MGSICQMLILLHLIFALCVFAKSLNRVDTIQENDQDLIDGQEGLTQFEDNSAKNPEPKTEVKERHETLENRRRLEVITSCVPDGTKVWLNTKNGIECGNCRRHEWFDKKKIMCIPTTLDACMDFHLLNILCEICKRDKNGVEKGGCEEDGIAHLPTTTTTTTTAMLTQPTTTDNTPKIEVKERHETLENRQRLEVITSCFRHGPGRKVWLNTKNGIECGNCRRHEWFDKKKIMCIPTTWDACIDFHLLNVLCEICKRDKNGIETGGCEEDGIAHVPTTTSTTTTTTTTMLTQPTTTDNTPVLVTTREKQENITNNGTEINLLLKNFTIEENVTDIKNCSNAQNPSDDNDEQEQNDLYYPNKLKIVGALGIPFFLVLLLLFFALLYLRNIDDHINADYRII